MQGLRRGLTTLISLLVLAGTAAASDALMCDIERALAPGTRDMTPEVVTGLLIEECAFVPDDGLVARVMRSTPHLRYAIEATVAAICLAITPADAYPYPEFVRWKRIVPAGVHILRSPSSVDGVSVTGQFVKRKKIPEPVLTNKPVCKVC